MQIIDKSIAIISKSIIWAFSGSLYGGFFAGMSAQVPAVTDLDKDPVEVIETGDWVRVDGDNGIVEVTKKG